MKVKLTLLLCLILTNTYHIYGQVEDNKHLNGDIVDYVNPYIGNVSHLLKPTHPVVQLPNSFLRVSPERGDFSQVTIHGLQLAQSIGLHLSPLQGDRSQIQPQIAYSYDNEKVTPYSYSVILNKQETKVTLGVSHKSAIYQLDFQKEGEVFLVLSSQEGMLNWDGKGISGYHSLGNGVKAYVYLLPDITPTTSYVLQKDELITGIQVDGKDVCIVLNYPENTTRVNVKYGISFISEDQAKKNMEEEVLSKSLGELHEHGRRTWNETLGKINVSGGTENEKAAFYTALYRSHYRPVSISENGRYFSAFDGQIHEDNGAPFYTHDAGWDTFRALHPLNILINPEMEEYILSSYLRMAEQMEELRMPKYIGFKGTCPGMISNHIILSFVDAYHKGLKEFDLDLAFEAGKSVVMGTTLAAVSDEPAGELNRFYQEHGYIPALWEGQKENLLPQVKPFTKRMALSATLGTAYDDWGLAQLAAEVGREEDYKYFCNRSLNYRNLFNSGTGFFHPRDKRGRFIRPIDYTYSGGLHGRDYYDESNGWIYRFGLQYNIQDLIDMMGGRDTFIANLDTLFSKPFSLPRHVQLFRYHNQTGIVGHFSMGNEPSFHIPYLYNYVGQPWKTQERMRELTKQWFRNDLFGIPGDDDGGALSAYAVFSYMGFYPVTIGMPVYNIGSPVFNHIRIKLSDGDDFEIITENNSGQNKYIQSATLNGELLNKPWFTHSDLMKGGKLVLQMGPRPNKMWGSGQDAAPPSMPISLSNCN